MIVTRAVWYLPDNQSESFADAGNGVFKYGRAPDAIGTYYQHDDGTQEWAFDTPVGPETIRHDVQAAVRAGFHLLTQLKPHAHGFYTAVATRFCAPVLLVALSACSTLAPDALRVEVAHESHATVGSLNCHAHCAEDALSTVNLLLKWKRGPLTLEAGEGFNLQGVNGGGFYGPREVFSARAGYEFSIWSGRRDY